ncbi:MAG: hypothetical protein ILP10_07410, partial [Lachnospiraceae bacterium]|nr:hypothetical protein [Lachnospiraceae bacterium]
GNGTCQVGNLNPEDERYVIGWHVTQEHSNFHLYNWDISQINGRLVLYKEVEGSATVKVTGSESAGGWDFADLEWFGATEDKDAPGEGGEDP